MAKTIHLVFVHGYSVTNLNTYGELPVRLREEGKRAELDIQVQQIFLGRYISFNDAVRMPDIARAFQTALEEQLSGILEKKERFVCITHSTGGPVVRSWWNTYYNAQSGQCPMSHLIMLAPANFGSALAQLGKGKLSRLVSWFDGVEPGQGVLDWLELGSQSAWNLNRQWIDSDGRQIGPNGIFPFVLTGQSIDRKLYDNLNSYTGELGSDGVVRSAAANLNAQYIRLVQSPDKLNELVLDAHTTAPSSAFCILKGKSHSGDQMGILKSVKGSTGDTNSQVTVANILRCIRVDSTVSYNDLSAAFSKETATVQKEELLETEKSLFQKRNYLHDRFSQVIFKLRDTEGFPVNDYDLVLTAGPKNDPNHLPAGFFADRQKNRLNNETVTYFFNYDIMAGAPAVVNEKGETIRAAQPGITQLGFQIRPRPDTGFVKYATCSLVASMDIFDKVLQPNSTTLFEIVLQRIVNKEVFQLVEQTGSAMPSKKDGDFSKVKPGPQNIK